MRHPPFSGRAPVSPPSPIRISSGLSCCQQQSLAYSRTISGGIDAVLSVITAPCSQQAVQEVSSGNVYRRFAYDAPPPRSVCRFWMSAPSPLPMGERRGRSANLCRQVRSRRHETRSLPIFRKPGADVGEVEEDVPWSAMPRAWSSLSPMALPVISSTLPAVFSSPLRCWWDLCPSDVRVAWPCSSQSAYLVEGSGLKSACFVVWSERSASEKGAASDPGGKSRRAERRKRTYPRPEVRLPECQ